MPNSLKLVIVFSSTFGKNLLSISFELWYRTFAIESAFSGSLWKEGKLLGPTLFVLSLDTYHKHKFSNDPICWGFSVLAFCRDEITKRQSCLGKSPSRAKSNWFVAGARQLATTKRIDPFSNSVHTFIIAADTVIFVSQGDLELAESGWGWGKSQKWENQGVHWMVTASSWRSEVNTVWGREKMSGVALSLRRLANLGRFLVNDAESIIRDEIPNSSRDEAAGIWHKASNSCLLKTMSSKFSVVSEGGKDWMNEASQVIEGDGMSQVMERKRMHDFKKVKFSAVELAGGLMVTEVISDDSVWCHCQQTWRAIIRSSTCCRMRNSSSFGRKFMVKGDAMKSWRKIALIFFFFFLKKFNYGVKFNF